jgi:hypothetical protein
VSQTNKEKIRAMAAPLKGAIQSALVGLFMASLPMAEAATIQINVDMTSGTTIKSSAQVNVANGTAYVGSFLNADNSQMSKTDVADLWNATRAGFNNLFAKFVSVTSGVVSDGIFSINAQAEVDNVNGQRLVGKNIYVLVVDNASSPNGFLLLASDGYGSFEDFEDPNVFDPVNRFELSGEDIVVDAELTIPPSSTVVGTAGSYSSANDAWSMTAIPGGVASIALNGSPSVTHYWGSTYVDAGATQTVTPVIKDSSNNTINGFVTMSSKVGSYTVAYTADGTTVTRTVTVKVLNPSADDDNDGLSNLLEYVLGGSQGSNDSAKLPVVSVVGSEVLLTFTARSDIAPATDVALGFLTTTTLSSTFQQELLTKKSNVNQFGIAPGYEKQQWVLAATTISKKFVRLQTSISAAFSSGI